MSLNIKITSKRKGSNPGGECIIYRNKQKLFRGYFKYCHSSRITGRSILSAKNQPVYEAITLSLAKKLGLKIPQFYVLTNKNRSTKFEDWKKFGLNNPSGRETYFISKMIIKPPIDYKFEEDARKILEKDRIYLESILIEDIINKRQNYLFESYSNENNEYSKKNNQISYIDVGCSFVHAVNGMITLSSKSHQINPKEIKKLRKGIHNKTIISADNKNLINLEELVSGITTQTLPILNSLGDEKRVPINALLNKDELNEIHSYILQGISFHLKEYAKRNLLI